MTRFTLMAILAGLSFAAQNARAGDIVPMTRQAPLLLKTLSYDRALKRQKRSAIAVGVVYRADDPGSKKLAGEFHAIMVKLSKKTIQGMALSSTLVAATNRADLKKAIADGKLTALYVAPGFAIKDVAALAEELQLNTMCGFSGCAREGVAVGLELEGQKPRLVLNLAAAESQGSDFASALFRVARLIQ